MNRFNQSYTPVYFYRPSYTSVDCIPAPGALRAYSLLSGFGISFPLGAKGSDLYIRSVKGTEMRDELFTPLVHPIVSATVLVPSDLLFITNFAMFKPRARRDYST